VRICAETSKQLAERTRLDEVKPARLIPSCIVQILALLLVCDGWAGGGEQLGSLHVIQVQPFGQAPQCRWMRRPSSSAFEVRDPAATQTSLLGQLLLRQARRQPKALQ
jgi:hypothetical protein